MSPWALLLLLIFPDPNAYLPIISHFMSELITSVVNRGRNRQVLPGLPPFPALLGKRQMCELEKWRSVEHMRDYTRRPVPRITCLEIPSRQTDTKLAALWKFGQPCGFTNHLCILAFFPSSY